MDTRYLILGGLMILLGILYFTGSPWILSKKFKNDDRVKPYLRKIGIDFSVLGIVLCVWGLWSDRIADKIIAKVFLLLLIIAGLVFWWLENKKFAKSIQMTSDGK